MARRRKKTGKKLGSLLILGGLAAGGYYLYSTGKLDPYLPDPMKKTPTDPTPDVNPDPIEPDPDGNLFGSALAALAAFLDWKDSNTADETVTPDDITDPDVQYTIPDIGNGTDIVPDDPATVGGAGLLVKGLAWASALINKWFGYKGRLAAVQNRRLSKLLTAPGVTAEQQQDMEAIVGANAMDMNRAVIEVDQYLRYENYEAYDAVTLFAREPV